MILLFSANFVKRTNFDNKLKNVTSKKQTNKKTKKQQQQQQQNKHKKQKRIKRVIKKFKAISTKGLTKYFINKQINLVFLIEPNIFLQIKHTLNILFYTVL